MPHRHRVSVVSGSLQGSALYSCLTSIADIKSLTLGHEGSLCLQARVAHWSFMALESTFLEELIKMRSLLPLHSNLTLLVIFYKSQHY